MALLLAGQYDVANWMVDKEPKYVSKAAGRLMSLLLVKIYIFPYTAGENAAVGVWKPHEWVKSYWTDKILHLRPAKKPGPAA